MMIERIKKNRVNLRNKIMKMDQSKSIEPVIDLLHEVR